MKLRGFPQNRIWSSLLLLLLTIGLLAGVSYAWLSTFYETEQPVSFDTGTTKAIPVHMWVYNTAEEGVEGWKEYSASADGGEDETAILTSILSKTADGTASKYDVKTMHLGSIHNLISVSDDNRVYFRFDLNGTDYGTVITLQHSLAGISGYNKEGSALSDDILQNLTALEGRTPHLKCKYAISKDKYTPGDIPSGPFWTDTRPENLRAGEYSGAYYLYLLVEPDLNTLLHTAIILSAQMPSQLLFDIDMELEVHPYVEP